VASRPTLEVCQALKDNRFSIMRCSLMPFARRIAATSRWLESSSPTAPSISKLRAFADVGKGRLELMRHMPQETVALVRELEQPLAQPLELPSQALEVVRPGDLDLVGESGPGRAR